MKIDRVVYVIRNRVNGNRYVGISNYGTAHRWRRHVQDAQCGRKCPLLFAIRKHGADAFTIRVLERSASDQELKAAEVRWIAKLGTYEKGYNCTLGGDGVHGLVFSPEQQRKRVRAGVTHAYKNLELPEKLIVRLYRQGWTLAAIARKVGTGNMPGRLNGPRRQRIRSVLRRAGVYRKPG